MVPEHFGGSHVGYRRHNNEDFYIIDNPLFVIADGMGGHAKGEEASKVACETICKFKTNFPQDLEKAYREADEAVNNIIYSRSRERSPGTTLTSLYFGDKVYVAHAGDTVAYRIRENKLEKLTTDHGVGPYISNFIGIGDYLRVDQKSVDYKEGDIFILASDGLTKHVSDVEIEDLTNCAFNSEEIVSKLTDLALQRGGTDNVTIIAIKVPNND